MANGLTRDTSVISISVTFLHDEVLISALAAALPSNATLRELSFSDAAYDCGPGLSPVLLALEKNTALKTLSLQVCDSNDDNESLYEAMKDGLGTNSTLESLHLNFFELHYNTALWCGAFSFLRTNKALKSLSLGLDDETPSSLSSLRMEIAAMLKENVSLETLSISTKPEDYAELITVLQRNTTLKTLKVPTCSRQLPADEDKQWALLLKKNMHQKVFRS
jgi:hypothetical protein